MWLHTDICDGKKRSTPEAGAGKAICAFTPQITLNGRRKSMSLGHVVDVHYRRVMKDQSLISRHAKFEHGGKI